MTDFLTSIATRSFGAPSAIRPRLTSLFEPVRDDASGLGVGADGTHTSAALFADHEPRSAQQLSGQLLAERADSAVRPVVARTAPDPNMHPQPIRDQALRSEEPTALVEVGPRPSGHAPAPLVPEDEDTEPPARKRQGVRSFMRVEPEFASVEDAFLSPSRATPPQTGERESSHAGLLVPAWEAATLAADLGKTLAFVGDRSPTSRRETHGDSAPGAAAEPDVHVTIGRIEVRAIPEGAQPRSSRPTSPVMSLEEYLRGRTQRGGR